MARRQGVAFRASKKEGHTTSRRFIHNQDSSKRNIQSKKDSYEVE